MKVEITTIDGQTYNAVLVGSIAEKLGDSDIPGLPHRSVKDITSDTHESRKG
jgi:hypothetical protein